MSNQPSSPSKGGKIIRIGTSSSVKKVKTSITARSGTVNLIDDCPTLPAVEHRNLQDQLIELERLRTLNIECMRERGVTQSVQEDNKMLRGQLVRADERIKGLEKVRIE